MPARPAADRAPLDVSGRPLALRDVDLDAFLHPKTIAVIGASQRPARPNTAMTNKFAAWSKANKAKFYPVSPNYEEIHGHKVYASLADVPGDIDLAIILTGQAVDTYEEVLARKAKFAVIFAAGFSETGKAGRQARAPPRAARGVRRHPPARPEHQPQRVRELPHRPRRTVDRARHAVGPPGPAGVPGPGDRHPAHALGAHRQRGRPRVRRLRRVLRRPARRRRRRLLHRGLQGRPHADARGRPRRVAEEADRDGEGRAHRRGRVDGAEPHRPPHRLRRDHRRGVPPVRRHPGRRPRRAARGLGRARPHPPVGHPGLGEEGPRARRVRLRDLRRHRRPHRRPARRRGALAPRPHEGDAEEAARRSHPRRTCA